MGYYIDLKSIGIDEYRQKLQVADLLPSRMLLKENLQERFDYFQALGIDTVADLQKALKKKDQFAMLAGNTLFGEKYLSVLLREINSIHPNPNKLSDFPGIPDDIVTRLNGFGFKDTQALFAQVLTPEQREKLSEKTGIPGTVILELAKLTDLSRIRWVGAVFARVLYEAGYDTAGKVAHADYNELYRKVTLLNKEKSLYKGNIGLHDMQLCVNAACEVPPEIIY